MHYEESAEKIPNCDIVVCGVSSFGTEWFEKNVLPNLKSGQTILSITKGLYMNKSRDLLPFPIRFSQLRPDVYFNAVGGPCISFELADRIYTEVAFCGKDKQVLETLRDAFATSYYHISITNDINGIETAVALKNAYAMAVSLAIGMYTKNAPALPEKYNAQAGLFYQAVREMNHIIGLLGGHSNALMFGVGDLYVTVFGGRTRRLGVLLGSGKDFNDAKEILKGVTLESVAIIHLISEFLAEKLPEYPLMQHIYNRVAKCEKANIPWEAMISDYFMD